MREVSWESVLQATASREHEDKETSRDFTLRVAELSIIDKGRVQIRLKGAWEAQHSTFNKEEVKSRNPLEGFGRQEGRISLEIESRSKDSFCLVERFDHGIFSGCVSKISGVDPISDFWKSIALWTRVRLLLLIMPFSVGLILRSVGTPSRRDCYTYVIRRLVWCGMSIFY